MLAALLCLATASDADVKELTQTELRQSVNTQETISLTVLIQEIEQRTGAEVVEIRAFGLDGFILYRALVQCVGGSLDAIMIDGADGSAVSSQSIMWQRVSAYIGAGAAIASQIGPENGTVCRQSETNAELAPSQ